MHSAPVSCRAEKKRPPAATIALVTARLPLPIKPNTTSPPNAWTVRPTTSETSMGRNLLVDSVMGMRTVAALLVLGALTAAFALALDLVGLGSATLFAALLVGLAAALIRPKTSGVLPR